MSFVNGYLLWGLPLAALPIIIHLINRQRHRTIPWGAMMFLLDAKRLQRSMAKLRYWLIMAMRVLSILGLVFAISRPMASGWWSSGIGQQAETVLLLVDRSPSMAQIHVGTQQSKLDTGIAKFEGLMRQLGDGKRIILIESNRCVPQPIELSTLQQEDLLRVSDATSNVPNMLSAAAEYLNSNTIPRADIWIISDLQHADWQPDDGRWTGIRDTFAQIPGVRIHLLTYPASPARDAAVRVVQARRRVDGETAELQLQLQIQGSLIGRSSPEQVASPRQDGSPDKRGNASPGNQGSATIEFVVNGARSALTVDSSANDSLLDHVIPLDVSSVSGWGMVALGADENPGNNRFYFTYGPEPTRRTTVVSDDADSVRAFRIAAEAGPDATLEYESNLLPSTRASEIDWQQASCVIWHAPLPTGTLAQQFDAYLNQGRPILCLPPDMPGETVFQGQHWGEWQAVSEAEPIGIGFWDNESDLFAKSLAGDALPVSKQVTKRFCELQGNHKMLARFTNEAPLLVRANAKQPLYFLTTLPRPDCSNLADEGVVLYAMTQRLLELGARTQGTASQRAVGTEAGEQTSLRTLRSPQPEGATSGNLAYYAGCHQLDERWLALNRGVSEDITKSVPEAELDALLSGLDFHTIQDEAGSQSALANEIWRLFLFAMAAALVAEAALCLT